MNKFYITSMFIMLYNVCITQNVGIGTITPQAKLEIVGDGATSSTNVFMLKNSIGDTLVRVRNDGKLGIGKNGSYGRTLNLGGNGMNFYKGNGDTFSGWRDSESEGMRVSESAS